MDRHGPITTSNGSGGKNRTHDATLISSRETFTKLICLAQKIAYTYPHECAGLVENSAFVLSTDLHGDFDMSNVPNGSWGVAIYTSGYLVMNAPLIKVIHTIH